MGGGGQQYLRDWSRVPLLTLPFASLTFIDFPLSVSTSLFSRRRSKFLLGSRKGIDQSQPTTQCRGEFEDGRVRGKTL